MELITSAKNKIIKQIISLKDKKHREESNLFLIEGERIVSEIPKSWDVKYYVFSEQFYKKIDRLKLENRQKHLVSDQIFAKISETKNPQGIIAVCEMKKWDLARIFEEKKGYFAILDKVMDPGNLGTIIRTADALGIDAVFLSKGCVDLYNPKVLRSTMGSIFHLPIFKNCDICELIDELKKMSFNIIGAALETEKNIYDLDFKRQSAVIIGNEANGISSEVIEKATVLAKIPMLGKVESINASIASSIIFYEIAKQRLK